MQHVDMVAVGHPWRRAMGTCLHDALGILGHWPRQLSRQALALTMQPTRLPCAGLPTRSFAVA